MERTEETGLFFGLSLLGQTAGGSPLLSTGSYPRAVPISSRKFPAPDIPTVRELFWISLGPHLFYFQCYLQSPADSAATSLLGRPPSLFSCSSPLIPYKLLCIHPSPFSLISSACTYLDSLSVPFGSWMAKGMEIFLTGITRRRNITFPSTGIVSVTS